MKLDYWAIYHPEYGYYLGRRGDRRYGRYVFGYNGSPSLYKTPEAAETASRSLPEAVRRGAVVVVCFVEFPYGKPTEDEDLLKEVE